MMRDMVIDMNDKQLLTLAQLQAFLDGTEAVDFSVSTEDRYDFIARTVRRFDYARLKRADKAVVLRFLERVSGYSRQQLSRLVKRGAERGPLSKRYHGSRTSFVRTYTSADVCLLAHTDTLHSTLSGLATKKLMERAYSIFGDAPAMSVWLSSPWGICITCANRPATNATAGYGPRPGLSPLPSVNGGHRHRITSLAIYAWTVCTKVTKTVSKASITSMPWTA